MKYKNKYLQNTMDKMKETLERSHKNKDASINTRIQASGMGKLQNSHALKIGKGAGEAALIKHEKTLENIYNQKERQKKTKQQIKKWKKEKEEDIKESTAEFYETSKGLKVKYNMKDYSYSEFIGLANRDTDVKKMIKAIMAYKIKNGSKESLEEYIKNNFGSLNDILDIINYESGKAKFNKD